MQESALSQKSIHSVCAGLQYFSAAKFKVICIPMYVFLTDSVFFIFKYKLCTIFKKLLLFRATITLICSILIIFSRTGGKNILKAYTKKHFQMLLFMILPSKSEAWLCKKIISSFFNTNNIQKIILKRNIFWNRI